MFYYIKETKNTTEKIFNFCMFLIEFFGRLLGVLTINYNSQTKSMQNSTIIRRVWSTLIVSTLVTANIMLYYPALMYELSLTENLIIKILLCLESLTSITAIISTYLWMYVRQSQVKSMINSALALHHWNGWSRPGIEVQFIRKLATKMLLDFLIMLGNETYSTYSLYRNPDIEPLVMIIYKTKHITFFYVTLLTYAIPLYFTYLLEKVNAELRYYSHEMKTGYRLNEISQRIQELTYVETKIKELIDGFMKFSSPILILVFGHFSIGFVGASSLLYGEVKRDAVVKNGSISFVLQLSYALYWCVYGAQQLLEKV